MSRIFLDHDFKLFEVKSVSEDPDSLISTLCDPRDDQNEQRHVLELEIANAILTNQMYRTKKDKDPTGRQLVTYTQLDPETTDLDDILTTLQLKVKLGKVEYENQTYRIGHLRFQFYGFLPVQVFIFIETSPQSCVMLCNTNSKMLAVVEDYLTEMGRIVDPLELPDSLLRESANSASSGVELAFSVATNDAALSTVVLNVDADDVDTFAGDGLMKGLFDYMRKETAIDFTKLSLSRVRSDQYLLESEGKVRFTSEMSFRPIDQEKPSIWPVLSKICALT